jgi:hypothetical protein
MRILETLSEEDKENYLCEVVDCKRHADYLVTDDTYDDDGDLDQGYICKQCNDEDDFGRQIFGEGGWE